MVFQFPGAKRNSAQEGLPSKVEGLTLKVSDQMKEYVKILLELKKKNNKG